MSRPFSHTFLALILKFLNFLQLFIGFSIVIYSWYILNQWNNHSHDNVPPDDKPPPPFSPSIAPWPSSDPNSPSPSPFYPRSPSPSPSPYYPHSPSPSPYYPHSPSPPYYPHSPYPSSYYSNKNLAVIALSAFNHGIQLPAPWFIYAFMGLGIMVCSVTCIGHIAAETINGCCLHFYTFLSAVVILMEAAFVAFVEYGHHWENDLPFDPTGELDEFRRFIKENVEITIWVGITVLIIQALSFLISLILRNMVSPNSNNDIEGDCDPSSGKPWEPLLNPHNEASGSVNTDGQVPRSDTWSSRMRKKYGLNRGSSSHNSAN